MSINSFWTPNTVAGDGEYAMASLFLAQQRRDGGKGPGNAFMEGTSGEACEKSALVRRRSGKFIPSHANGAENPAPFLRPFPGENGFFYSLNVELSGLRGCLRSYARTPG
jgi:hypothetical protein